MRSNFPGIVGFDSFHFFCFSLLLLRHVILKSMSYSVSLSQFFSSDMYVFSIFRMAIVVNKAVEKLCSFMTGLLVGFWSWRKSSGIWLASLCS